MSEKPRTCMPMYREAFLKYGGGVRRKERAFAAGFVTGQAEKIYLGACDAAMFRPNKEDVNWLWPIVHDVCERYMLYSLSIGDEIWIFNRNDRQRLQELKELYLNGHENSPHWHAVRAGLCGIPWCRIDEEFHNREGAEQQ